MPHEPHHPPADNPYNISRTGHPIHTCEALHLVIFSIPITFFPLLSPNILLSALFSKVWLIRPSSSMTAFSAHAQLQPKFHIYYKGHVYRQQVGRKRIALRKVTSILLQFNCSMSARPNLLIETVKLNDDVQRRWKEVLWSE
jgi:hypothetical protein